MNVYNGEKKKKKKRIASMIHIIISMKKQFSFPHYQVRLHIIQGQYPEIDI